MEEGMAALGAVSVVVMLVGFVLAVLWIILPFVVFRINGHLWKLREEVKEVVNQLKVVNERLWDLAHPEGERTP